MQTPRSRFETLVREAIDALPEPFAGALGEVPVIVEEAAPADDPDLYGLYLGTPLTDPSPSHGPPPMIAIYMHPLVDDFDDPDELREEVRVTVLHELGHHLGMDEDQLERLGYG